MGEHSVMDGTPTQRMCDDLLDAINNPDFDKHVSTPSSSVDVKPQLLDWHVSPKTKTAIERATNEARELVGSQMLGYVSTSYGKKVNHFHPSTL
jgi:carnitine O-acetyltransferase